MDDREERVQRRREIDAMVREALRAEAEGSRPPTVLLPEDLSDAHDATPHDPPVRRRRVGWLRLTVAVACVVAVIAAGTVVLRSEVMPLAVQVALGRETAQPAVPTRYGDGVYQFHRVQNGNPRLPIGFDPCRRMPVRMNYKDAPDNALDMLEAAIGRINRLSGLHLFYAGASVDEVYDDHAGPVLVTWTRSSGTRGSGGIGYTGRPEYSHGLSYNTTGAAIFGTGYFAAHSRDEQQAAVDRTMAQVVGLDDIDSGGELMSYHHENRTTFGHGDLTGLAILGDLPCA